MLKGRFRPFPLHPAAAINLLFVVHGKNLTIEFINKNEEKVNSFLWMELLISYPQPSETLSGKSRTGKFRQAKNSFKESLQEKGKRTDKNKSIRRLQLTTRRAIRESRGSKAKRTPRPGSGESF